MDDDSRSFKPSSRPFVFAFWPVTTLGVLSGLLAISELPLSPGTVAFSLLGCLVLSVPIALVAAEFWGVVVSPQGLRAPDYAGRQYLVRWTQIEFVRPINFLGLKYLRVFSGDARPVWLPLFLTDMPAFRVALAQHSAAGTPLVEYFARNNVPS